MANDLTFALSSDNNLTISNIRREDGEDITAITSVTASLLNEDGYTITGSSITLSVTAVATTYRGVFPSTISLSAGQKITVVAVIVADGLTRVVTGSVTATGGYPRVLSPGGFDGRSLTLNRREAYMNDISNAIAIEVTHPSFNAAMLTDGSEVWLRLKRRFSDDNAINVEGEIESVDGNTATVSFELTSTQSGALVPGDNAYRFDVEVVLQGDSSLVVTPIIDGQVNVRADI